MATTHQASPGIRRDHVPEWREAARIVLSGPEQCLGCGPGCAHHSGYTGWKRDATPLSQGDRGVKSLERQ
ncbi:MAG: hypothetical protein MUC66_01780 [Methanolinea sp.]|nr:hypothetical protein [Methanolinea sp.]